MLSSMLRTLAPIAMIALLLKYPARRYWDQTRVKFLKVGEWGIQRGGVTYTSWLVLSIIVIMTKKGKSMTRRNATVRSMTRGLPLFLHFDVLSLIVMTPP